MLASTHPFGHLDPTPREVVARAGGELVLNPHERKLTPDELKALLPGAEVVIASTERYSADVLDAAPELRLIARTGVGLDGIDLELCRARGVQVSWTPDGPSDSVAELTVGLIVSLLRQVLAADRAIRGGDWSRRTGWLLRERTVGLLGLGRCGSRVAKLLAPFGCRLLGCDVDPAAASRAAAAGVEVVELPELLARSEVLSLHVPLTPETRGLFDASHLAQLLPGSYLINTARGELVDEPALCDALEAGQLAGAALDVYAEEPYQGPLTARDDVILTAHMGSCSDAGRRAMELGAARAVAAYLQGEPIPDRLV
ncbi:MAG: phosphoglycerate dehydrogenase [Planctomycetes bacterium]|nr:phosphoglycerate dehydrogenase [Planctomycetota bacterium]